MAAFDHVSGDAAREDITLNRELFLDDPWTYEESGLPLLSDFRYPGNKKYVSASATSGTGTSGDPWTLTQAKNNDTTSMELVYTGDFRGATYAALSDQTHDMRGWDSNPPATFSTGLGYGFSDIGTKIIDVGSNVYYITDAAQDWTSSFHSLAVRQGTVRNNEHWAYAGLTRTYCGDAGFIALYDAASDGTGRVELRPPWKLEVGMILGYIPDVNGSDDYPASIVASSGGTLTSGIPIYVKSVGTVGIRLDGSDAGTQSGFQVVTLSVVSAIGTTLLWSAANVTAMKTHQTGTTDKNGCLLFYTDWAGHVGGTGVPTTTTLDEEDMCYAPWLSRYYFKTTTPLVDGDEVVLTTSQDTLFNASTKDNVHVIGGTAIASHRMWVFSSSTTNSYFWATKVVGGNRGHDIRSASNSCGTVFPYGSRCKYPCTAENAEQGVANHTDNITPCMKQWLGCSDCQIRCL